LEEHSKTIQSEELDPWSLFIYAMKAPMTRNRYQTRLAKFLDFIGIAGTRLEDRARAFAERGKNDSNWAFNNIVKFVHFQNNRVNKEKYLTVGKRISEEIDSYLSEGHIALKIQRFGLGKDTRYHVTPA
jgi:hypothetical protein